MKIITTIAVMAAFLAPATALAESSVTETFGNAPVVGQPEWANGVLGVVNLKTRVYYTSSVNGLVNAVKETFYYKGDARDLSEALRKFAAVKTDERQLILLPGQGNAQAFSGKAVRFDWQFQVRNGIYREAYGGKHAVLKVYVTAEKARGSIDRKKAEKWLRDLDNDSFETRQAASRELGKLGIAAKPLLRKALKGRPSLEVQRRIERLLATFQGLDADDLEVPTGMTFLIDLGKDEQRPGEEVKKRLAIFRDLQEFQKSREK